MAAIGIAIESGSMHTVLVEPTSGELLADLTSPLVPDAASVLATAIGAMRTEAATLGLEVDALGVACRSEAERAEFVTALGDDHTQLFSASESFLRWLTQSTEFADAKSVLLYYMGEAGVSISLADVEDASLTPTKAASLDSMSPERIGSTIPLAWEVVDEAGKKPDFVALFGDKSSNRDLIDILALGLGVPVVRVADADQVAARGAALLASAQQPEALPLPEQPSAPTAAPAESESESQKGPSEATVPLSAASSAPVGSDADPFEVDEQGAQPALVAASAGKIGAGSWSSGASGRKAIFAAVLLAGVASAGVAVAATQPSAPESTAEQVVDRRDSGADLAGETRQVDPTTVDTLAPIVPPIETIPPTSDSAETVQPTEAAPPWTPQGQPWTTQPTEPTQPPPWTTQDTPPAPTRTTIDPPQFTLPAIVPEPGKSPEQLEQEAWERHWQHTGEWIEQELSGG